MNFLASIFFDIFYPPVCVKCGKLNFNWMCDDCTRIIDGFRKNIFVEKPAYLEFSNGDAKEYSKPFFDGQLYIFEYKQTIRKLMIEYKFFDKSYISHFFAAEIFHNKKVNEILSGYDIMIPVPMEKEKEKRRGYNQTVLILNELKNLGWNTIQVSNDVLLKNKKTKTQSTLSGIDRKNNVKDAYAIRQEKHLVSTLGVRCNIEIKDKNIVVFDDIFTTGATANEISKILKQNGANKILIFTIAKD